MGSYNIFCWLYDEGGLLYLKSERVFTETSTQREAWNKSIVVKQSCPLLSNPKEMLPSYVLTY